MTAFFGPWRCSMFKFGMAAMFVVTLCPAAAMEEAGRWWPVQSMPQAIVRTTSLERFPAPHGPYHMLVQSVAGLAAKAVNAGQGDELVWVTSTNPDLEAWYRRFLADHPQLAGRGIFEPWELVDRYVQKGIIQGYVLYTWDKSPGELAEDAHRPGMDCSVNVATSVAGLVDAVLIEERWSTGTSDGLKLLLDARGKTPSGVSRPTRRGSTAACSACRIRRSPIAAIWRSPTESVPSSAWMIRCQQR